MIEDKHESYLHMMNCVGVLKPIIAVGRQSLVVREFCPRRELSNNAAGSNATLNYKDYEVSTTFISLNFDYP